MSLLAGASHALKRNELAIARRLVHQALLRLENSGLPSDHPILGAARHLLVTTIEQYRERVRGSSLDLAEFPEDDEEFISELLDDLVSVDKARLLEPMNHAVREYIGVLVGFLAPIPNVLRFVPIDAQGRTVLSRARANDPEDQRFTHLRDLLAPPDAKARQGRANLRGRSVLYCCQMDNAVFAEVRARPGSLMTVSRWCMKAGAEFCGYAIIPDTAQMRSQYPALLEAWDVITERNDARLMALAKRVVEVFVDHFTRPVGTDERDRYGVSAWVSELFLFHRPRHWWPGHPIDAVVYPCVEAGYGVNLAMRPDAFERCFVLDRVNEYMVHRVASPRELGGVGYLHESGRAFAAEPDGRIIWDGTRLSADLVPEKLRLLRRALWLEDQPLLAAVARPLLTIWRRLRSRSRARR